MNLKEEIRKLVEIHELDSAIYSLRKTSKEDKPSEVQVLKDEFEGKKEVLSSIDGALKELQLARKNRELDLASKEEGIRKAQSQLYQLKTNKEYHAKMTEIESLKADVSRFEEEVIKTLDAIETKEGDLKKAKEDFSLVEKDFKAKENKINEEIKKIEGEIDSLQGRRKILADKIDKNTISMYERLLEARGGIALASADGESCSACNLRVTAQKINEIKMYRELTFCEACARMLYMKEDFE